MTSGFDKQNYINSLYSSIVKGLIEASDQSIPKRKQNFYKPWWDKDVQLLKEEAIKSHRAWLNESRPMLGTLYDIKSKCKRKYRNFIRNKKKEENLTISNKLHDALCDKNTVSFWKTWKCKFNSKKNKATCVNRLSEDLDIANTFKDNFSQIMKHDPVNDTDDKNIDFLTDFDNYKGDMYTKAEISVEMVDFVVNKLDKGKAVDCDSVSYEHFIYCHPIVTCVITKLFNLIIKLGIVPDAFGKGIIVPIPKGSKRSYNDVDDCRGITICNIVSKIFEHCLSLQCGKFLGCSDRQFGFKKGASCAQAIYTMRRVVNHFTEKGSTVNLCTLDLSKAFDKISHLILFRKLMEEMFQNFS